MSTHKLRPKLKKYIRLGLLKKKGAAVSKKQNFFFSPDLNWRQFEAVFQEVWFMCVSRS